MKKIVLMVCLITAALSVKAVPIDWSADVIKNPSGTLLTSVGQMYVELYLLSAPQSASTTANVWEGGYGSGGTLLKQGTISVLVPGVGGVIQTTAGKLGDAVWANADIAIYMDPDGKNYKNASFYMKFYYNAAGGANKTTFTQSGVSQIRTTYIANYLSSQVTTAFTDVSNNHIQWTAVPEPTTMALFGLGGLAMVIRRKMRKEA